MIAFLSATVAKKEPRALIVEIGGIGYRVFCTLSTIASIQENAKILLHTHHHVREDEISLFGFLEVQQLHFFEKLIAVSGIGPKTALEILEVAPGVLQQAIESGDVEFLKGLKGIGRKTAERIIVELRGNLPEMGSASGKTVPPEVLQALTDLGFERGAIHKAFQKPEALYATAEEMVRWFLQNQAR